MAPSSPPAGTARGKHMSVRRNLLGHMERLTELSRIQRSLQKPPDHRTEPDAERLQAETEHVEALKMHGLSVHHDLCYVLEALHIQRGETKRMAALPGSGGALFIVLSGSVTVYTSKPELYESVLDCMDPAERGGARDISPEHMKELFNSLDEDKSGAIDALELMHALEMLGLDVSWGEMEEAIKSVDVDGSGELDYEEFQMVLQEKLGLNKKHVAKGWRAVEGMEGTVCQVFEDGDVFGELAVLEGQTLEGTVTSEEQEPVVAVVTRANYDHVVVNGFKGDLKKKLDFLKGAALVKQLLPHSDIKALSYACSLENRPARSVLYRQGAKNQDMVFLVAGEVKMLMSAELDVEPALIRTMPQKMSAGSRVGSPKSVMRSVIEVVRVQAFDILCEAELQNDATHAYTAEAVGEVTVMSLSFKKMAEIISSADAAKLLHHARLRETWRSSRAARCSDTRGGVMERQLEKNLAERAKAEIADAEAAASCVAPWGGATPRGVGVSDCSSRITGITLASPHSKSQRWTAGLKWIPKDATSSTQERQAREVAETLAMQAQRDEMLLSLQRMAPGRAITSPAILVNEPCGWNDIRANVSVYREAERAANTLVPRRAADVNPWDNTTTTMPMTSTDPASFSPRFNNPRMTPHRSLPDLRSAVPADVVAALRRSAPLLPPRTITTAGSSLGKKAPGSAATAGRFRAKSEHAVPTRDMTPNVATAASSSPPKILIRDGADSATRPATSEVTVTADWRNNQLAHSWPDRLRSPALSARRSVDVVAHQQHSQPHLSPTNNRSSPFPMNTVPQYHYQSPAIAWGAAGADNLFPSTFSSRPTPSGGSPSSPMTPLFTASWPGPTAGSNAGVGTARRERGRFHNQQPPWPIRGASVISSSSDGPTTTSHVSQRQRVTAATRMLVSDMLPTDPDVLYARG